METRDAGRLGGFARAANMTKDERVAAARLAANARWEKERKDATHRGDAKRRAKAKRRKVEKMRAESRKTNRCQ